MEASQLVGRWEKQSNTVNDVNLPFMIPSILRVVVDTSPFIQKGSFFAVYVGLGKNLREGLKHDVNSLLELPSLF